jgi:hypothetical protein
MMMDKVQNLFTQFFQGTLTEQLLDFFKISVGPRERTRASSGAVYGSGESHQANSPDWFHQVCSGSDV